MRLPVILTIAAAVALASAVDADILVKRNGAKIQTMGPWKVKGKQIIYTTPDGEVRGVRTVDYDLYASAAATRAAQENGTANPKPKPRSRVLKVRAHGAPNPSTAGPTPRPEAFADALAAVVGEGDEEVDAATAEALVEAMEQLLEMAASLAAELEEAEGEEGSAAGEDPP